MSLTFEKKKHIVAYDIDDGDVIYYTKKTGGPVISDGDFEFVPNLNDGAGNEICNIYIVGASGCGKSFIAREIAMNYKRLQPKNEIILITGSND